MFFVNKKQLSEIVSNNYQEIATGFNITRKKELPQILYDITKNIKPNSSILDAACGNGRLLKALASENILYTGFDASSNLLELAKNNWPNNKFFLANLENYNGWPEGTFDNIFCLAAWHHIPGRKKQLEILLNLAKRLNPDGELVISVWDFYGQRRFYGRIIKSYLMFRPNELIFPWKKTGSLRYYHAFSKRALNSIIKKSGLYKKNMFAAGGNYYLILGLKKL